MTTNNTNTIKLHRVLTAPPERVYRAFLDAAAICKWLSPNGFTCQVHHLEAKVGGTYKASFTNFTSGKSHSFGGEYLELKPNELIRYRITRGGVLKNHEGLMRFSPNGTGSRLDYTIDFDGKAPGVGPLVKAMLTRNITAALRKYAAEG